MHQTAADVLRLLFRFVFQLAVEGKTGTEVCRDTCLHTRMKRGSQASPSLSGLKSLVFCNTCPALLLVDTAGRATACTGLLGELSRAPAVSQQSPTRPGQALRMQRERGEGRDQGC